jgi:hypothetical protein
VNLKSVEFYQSVRLWDNHEYKTVTEGKNRQLEGIELDLRDHIVTIYCPGKPRLILVPTANMRLAMIENYRGESAVVMQEKTPELAPSEVSKEAVIVENTTETVKEIHVPVKAESKYETLKPKAPPKRIKGQG